MMDFSLILNSRKRTDTLEGFLWHVNKNTANLSNIEVLVRLDDDDHVSIDEIKTLTERYGFVRFIVGPRPPSLNESLNELARLSHGNYIWIMNDDAYIIKERWDEAILDHTQQAGYSFNQLIYIGVGDTSVDKENNKEYASFPIFSRKCLDVLGFLMYSCFVGLGSDVAAYRLFNHVDRTINIAEPFVDHIYHNTMAKVFSPDQTASEMRRNTYNINISPWGFDVSQEVEVLQQAIDNGY